MPEQLTWVRDKDTKHQYPTAVVDPKAHEVVKGQSAYESDGVTPRAAVHHVTPSMQKAIDAATSEETGQ